MNDLARFGGAAAFMRSRSAKAAFAVVLIGCAANCSSGLSRSRAQDAIQAWLDSNDGALQVLIGGDDFRKGARLDYWQQRGSRYNLGARSEGIFSAISPFGIGPQVLTLANPSRRVVTAVTGIVADSSGQQAEAEFTWDYVPPLPSWIRRDRVPASEAASAARLLRYDDGWRVERVVSRSDTLWVIVDQLPGADEASRKVDQLEREQAQERSVIAERERIAKTATEQVTWVEAVACPQDRLGNERVRLELTDVSIDVNRQSGSGPVGTKGFWTFGEPKLSQSTIRCGLTQKPTRGLELRFGSTVIRATENLDHFDTFAGIFISTWRKWQAKYTDQTTWIPR